MRCPSCNKFVPFDEPEVEVTNSDVNDTSLDIEARIVLKCADCGEELKDMDFSESLALDELHECGAEPKDCEECDGMGHKEGEEGKDGVDCDKCKGEGIIEPGDPDKEQFELLGDIDAESFDRFEDKDRNGKKIKSMRYMKHFYGATLTGTCQCNRCNEQFPIEVKVEEQGSGFNELV